MSTIMSSMNAVAQRPFIKPSSAVIKRLFDFPDPNETKKLHDIMVQAESDRLERVWNFDVKKVNSAGKNDENSGESNQVLPNSFNRRFNWEKQDRNSVPNYYSRSYHRHHSERRHKVHPYLHEFHSPNATVKENKSPAPLKLRDENILKAFKSKRSSAKQAITFTSPPKFSSNIVPPTLARFVSALRVPLPIEKSPSSILTPSSLLTPQTEIEVKETEPKTTVPTKNQASRQLFHERSNLKRSSSPTFAHQPKITGLCFFNCFFVMISTCFLTARKLVHNAPTASRLSIILN